MEQDKKGKKRAERKKKRSTAVELTKAAMAAAVFCVMAPHTFFLPASPVGITFGTFLLYLTGGLLGARLGCVSVFLYLCLGFFGLPVFSGYTAGVGVLLGPTGGYLLGYLPCVAVVGALAGKRAKGRYATLLFALGMVLGTLVLYMVGMLWFLMVYTRKVSLLEAVYVCILPFLPGDAGKLLLGVILYQPLRRLLAQHRRM